MHAAQTTSFLKLRWFVGTAFLIVPVAFCQYRTIHFRSAPLPHDAPVHVAIAWAVGALMSFLADTYRRSVPVSSSELDGYQVVGRARDKDKVVLVSVSALVWNLLSVLLWKLLDLLLAL